MYQSPRLVAISTINAGYGGYSLFAATVNCNVNINVSVNVNLEVNAVAVTNAVAAANAVAVALVVTHYCPLGENGPWALANNLEKFEKIPQLESFAEEVAV